MRFQWSKLDKQQTVSVVPPLKFGKVCLHKAIEARAHKNMPRSKGMLSLAQFALSKAGEDGKKVIEEGLAFKEKLTRDFINAWKERRAAKKAARLAAAQE